MTRKELEKLCAQMTLEEKAGLCSGSDFWHTKPVERLGIPAMMVSDGPHGLRKQKEEGDHLGVNDSIKAVCFPTGCTIAASFDRDLIREMGEALGVSCQAEGVGIILGPAVNIKRSPLCGRNFEYYSEDPYAAGEMAASYIEGVQSKNVGTSIKHFMANSQETRRMSSDSRVDERTMREIYLPAFETAVKKTDPCPWTVMCSYNRINGTYAAENHWLLTELLRDEWGFDGFVVSDWGAVNDRVAGIKAGLDLEMPPSFGVNDKLIVEAVKNGDLDEAVLDETVIRILNIIYRFMENRDETAVFDRDAQHNLSRKAAEESLVLLKNEGVLPFKKEQKIAVIGQYAEKPRYQGGGSSHINSYKVSGILEFVKDMENVTYAQGYDDGLENAAGMADDIDSKKKAQTLLEEAVRKAKEADVAVIFAGLPDSFESEGYDRKHMRMPDSQNLLIHEIAKVQPNTVVVLHNGSPVEMPWAGEVKGILEAYLGGEAVGEAEYNILFGNVNPSGRLSETFPLRLEDNPSYLYYIGEGDMTEYREGIFVGYRYYDTKRMPVLFPFGHGLSYTEFTYSNLRLECGDEKTDNILRIRDIDRLTVSVDVTNTGSVEGKEVVQLYVSDEESSVIRPQKELKGFEKVSLLPGETKTVHFTLDARAFAYYHTELKEFFVESGIFSVLVGSSSRDIRGEGKVYVEGTREYKPKYHLNTTFGDIMKDERAADILAPLLKASTLVEVCDTDNAGNTDNTDKDGRDAFTEMQKAMMEYLPLRAMVSFQDGSVDFEKLNKILDQLNG